MTSRNARHDLDDQGDVDCQPPLLSLYAVLFRMEQEGKPLPVRIPLTVCVDCYFIRAMYVMEPRAARPGEPKFPPPMTLVRRPAQDLNARRLLQELVEHDWRHVLPADELSDDEDEKKRQDSHDDQSAAGRLAAARAAHKRTSGPSGFEAAGLVANSNDDDADADEDDIYGSTQLQAFNSKRKFNARAAVRAAIWAQVSFFDPELEMMRVEYLNSHSIRDLLRSASSRKSRAIITQFLPPDDTAPPYNEMINAQLAGNFFRVERRVNKHDVRDPSFTLNERGSCDQGAGSQGAHSEEVNVPGMLQEKIEAALRSLVQCIEYVSSKRVLVLRVTVKFRRGAVYLMHGEQLTFFDHSVPRVLDPSVLFAAASPSSRAELRKRIRIATKHTRDSRSASPQGVAQQIIGELAAVRQHKKMRVLSRSAHSMYNLKAGMSESAATLGRELRQMKRTMSRATMPGHQLSLDEKEQITATMARSCLAPTPQKKSSSMMRTPSSSSSQAASATTSPAPAAKVTVASHQAPRVPPLFVMNEEVEVEGDNSGEHHPRPIPREESSNLMMGAATSSTTTHPSPTMRKKFDSSKMVSFAGAAMFAEDSDFDASDNDSEAQFEKELEAMGVFREEDEDDEPFFFEDDDDDDDDFFDTETDKVRRGNRKRALHREASMMRDKLSEKERATISATKWLRGGEPLLTQDDIRAISLLREEERGVASKRLSQFRSSEGLVAPSLLFLSMKCDADSITKGDADSRAKEDMDRFWRFREKLLRAKVDAALRKELLTSLRSGE